MPPIEVTDRWQYAVYWQKVGVDRYGQPVIAMPVQINVRHQRSKEVKPAAATEAITLDAEVVTDRDLVTGSILYLGPLSDFAGSGSVDAPEGTLYQVDEFDKVPDLKGRNFRRVAGLRRYKDTLPTIQS